MHTRETSMLNSRRDVHVAFHGGNEPTNRPRYELFRDKNQTDDAIFLVCSRDFHGAREESVEQRAPPGWRHCQCFVPWNGQPTLNQPFETTLLARFPHLLMGMGCTGNEHFAPFISIRQTGTVRAVDTKCSHTGRGGGERVKGGADRGRGWVSTPAKYTVDTRYYTRCLCLQNWKSWNSKLWNSRFR